MKHWPIRARLTAGSALATSLALLALIIVAAANAYREEIAEIDRHLATESVQLISRLGSNRDWSEADRSAKILAENEVIRGFAVRSAGGIEHVFPATLDAATLKWPPAGRYRRLRSGESDLRLGSFAYGEKTLLVMADVAPAFDNTRQLVVACLWALPIVLIVVVLGSWWMAGLALRPIAAITRAAGTITAERLDARLPVPRADDEIGRHIRVLNAMFDRLESSFRQASRFSADASHELRTPLTILRGELEEALRSGRWTPEQEPLLVSLLEQTDRLRKISENLLLLARFDSGKFPLAREPVDLCPLLAAAAEDAEMLASPLGVTVRKSLAPAVTVSGDPVLIRRAVLNLIDNAVRYNRPGGEISLTLRREGPDALLVISNTGPGIPADRHADLFQRFFRVADDRNRSAGGSGLGLSLVREIAVAHGGDLVLSLSGPDATEFTLRLPAA